MLVDCPHCESRVDAVEKGHVDLDLEHTGVPTKVMLLECRVCHSPLVGCSEVVQIRHDEWDYGSVTRLWPSPDGDVDWEIPEISRISLVEAQICFRAKAYSACAVMCGRAIEGLCKHHKTKSDYLGPGLQELKDTGVIDDRIHKWGEALRKHRNLGAHATTEKVTKEDAQDLLDFATAICEYVFVLNAKFERFQQRRAKS